MKRHAYPVHFVVGPTASGKSAWALGEARKNGGVIVNADSVQVYKSLDIGSAKPTPAERQLVPHFLYDVVEPDQEFTAGDYRRAALAVLEREAVKNPVYVVGGSGFYIQALEKGMFDVGPISPEVGQRVARSKEAATLYEDLLKVDSVAAERIGASDAYRLERALEVVWQTGQTMQKIKDDFTRSGQSLHDRFEVRKVGFRVDREVLRARILRRTEAMLAAGFIDEVKSLLSRGFAAHKALGSVGYREVTAYLRNELAGDDLIAAIVTSTMQLAKRQMTWFKRDASIEWREI